MSKTVIRPKKERPIAEQMEKKWAHIEASEVV